MAGSSAQWNENDYLNAQKNVFMFDNVHEMDNGQEMYAIGGSSNEWALLSYMARIKLLLRRPLYADGNCPPRWFQPFR